MSLFWNRIIKGANVLVGITERKWVNHKEIEDKPSIKYFLFLNWNIKPKSVPVKRIIKMRSFSWEEIRNSCSEDNNHDNHEPDVIAKILNIIIGIKHSIDWWLEIQAWDLIRGLLEKRVIRRE